MAQKEEVLLARVAAKTGAQTSSSSGHILLHPWPFCVNGVQKGHPSGQEQGLAHQ